MRQVSAEGCCIDHSHVADSQTSSLFDHRHVADSQRHAASSASQAQQGPNAYMLLCALAVLLCAGSLPLVVLLNGSTAAIYGGISFS